MLNLLGGIFLGWSLGANDGANVFGSAVASRMLRFWTAAVLASIFILLGALLEGGPGIETLKGLTQLNVGQAVVCSLAAAVTVTLMTILGLPVSTSQAVVGAILGMGFLNRQLYLAGLEKVLVCWLGTPLGGMVAAVILYRVLGRFYNALNVNLFESDRLIRLSLIIAGTYGAYALGANNVANVTAVYVGSGQLKVFSAALIGGLSIALGVLTFSKPVMKTIGREIVRLDAFSALIVVLSEAITVHIYAFVGVPVSTSQALVGAVMGVGIVRGIRTVQRRTLAHIFVGWLLAPVVACFLSILINFVIHLKYIP
jgi:PiT family inorganic phosphate transporter